MNQIRHFYVGVKGLIVRDDGKVLLLKPREVSILSLSETGIYPVDES